MTTWLEFRAELIMFDVPEIQVKLEISDDSNFGYYYAECPFVDCNWSEDNLVRSETEEQAELHKQWHEDGMPE